MNFKTIPLKNLWKKAIYSNFFVFCLLKINFRFRILIKDLFIFKAGMNEETPYYINCEDRGEYLYALVGGRMLSPEIAKLYWNEIAEVCSQLKKSKILIEKDFTKSVSAPEMLEMGVYLGKILSGKKIAFIDRYKNESVNELGKVVARNEGVIMRVFKDLKEAENWIKKV